VNRVIVVASHRRSGTHLMLDSLRANAPDVHPAFMTLERIEPSHAKHLPPDEFDRRLRSRRGIVLVKTHALPDARDWQSREAGEYAMRLLAGAPAIYVHRDGRDVLVSLYHYMASYSADTARRPFGEFIRARQNAPDAPALSRPAYWQHHALTWLRSEPRALAAFALMQTDFETTLRGVADRLDLRLRPTLSQVTLDARGGWANAMRRILLRRFGAGGGRRSTAIRPRAGGSGGWRAAFDAEDVAFFESEAAEALRTLGYG
jgi:hypothetical protein